MRLGGRRATHVVVAAAFVASTLVMPFVPAEATANAVSLTSSSASATPGSRVVLSAAMPVVGAGTVSQEIIQTIDPAKVTLTAVSDIQYPTGWSLSYSVDGTTFTSIAPSTNAGWAAIRAVKATGNVDSQGAENGYQIATGTATGAVVNLSPATITAGGTGDGYQAFFDPARTRIFNVFHHKTGAALDCHVLTTGATCAGFPFGTFPSQTGQYSTGRVVGTKIWIPMYKQVLANNNYAGSSVGFSCVDIAAVLASGGAPSMCDPAYVPLATGQDVHTGQNFAVPGDQALFAIRSIDGVSTAGSVDETRLWSSLPSNGKVICLDTATAAPCAGMPANGWPTAVKGWRLNASYTVGGYFTSMVVSNGRIYVEGSNSTTNTTNGNLTIACVLESDPSVACPGFTGGKDLGPNSARNGPAMVGNLVELPAADGSTAGVCLLGDTRNLSYGNANETLPQTSTAAVPCWDATGAAFTGPASLSTMVTSAFSYGFVEYQQPLRVGSRIYWGNGVNFNGSADYPGRAACWDASKASGAGGPCANIPATGYATDNYSVTPDPAIPDCMWVTRHEQPNLRSYNMVTNVTGCSSIAPTRASFPGRAVVPRMACSAASTPVRAWKSFTLTNPAPSANFSAVLSVRASDGSSIVGWQNVPLTPGTALNLSTLDPVVTGTTPSFLVDFTITSGSLTSATAAVQAVGDAPELCINPKVQAVCPVGVGPLSGLTPSSFTASASGSATDSSNAVTVLTPSSLTLSISTPSNEQCGATLSGRATSTGTTVPIANATVSLLDSSGNPVLDGQGNPITTTTAADGNYSFGFLFPGGYKVRFNDVGDKTISSTTVSSGGSGTTSDNTAATSLVSNMSTLMVGVNGVVNASYFTPAMAAADTSTGAQGAVQTINVKANDIASTGANITSPTITFCSVDSPASGCTLTTKTVAGQGVYTLSAGNVVFTPCSAVNTPAGASCTGAFTGTATSVSYQITDSVSSSATSTITPTVVPPPSATADAQSGAWDTNQTYAPHQNDVAGAGTTLATSPAGICLNTVTVASSCTSTTLTVANQGTYTLNTATGAVTFDPLPAFTGTATGIKYAATDALGQKVLSTITPTVVPPPPPSANADTTVGKVGQVQTVTPFANDTVGASGITFTSSSVKLCSTGQSAPSCTATSLVRAGEGTYSVNTTTGVVTFTPCSAPNTPAGASCTGAFTGTATPVTYQVGTSFGDTASSTYTPKVVPPPTAVADTQTGAWDTNQTFTPTSNDAAGSGASLVAAPSGICLNSVTVASSCTATSLTVSNQGTYTLNPSTGVVTFDPLPTFTGTATPIKYAVADNLGQQNLATITPTVTPPAAPTANPESKTVIPGGSVAFTTLTGVGGLASTGGPTFTTSATCLVDASVTPNTCGTTLTIAGEGTWSLNTATGVVTFTASQSVTPGTKTAVTYRVTDATGQTATSTLTPIVPPPPTVNPDSSVDEQNQTQVLSPLSNDSAAASTSLNASSLRLCPTNAIAPFNATNCNLSSLSIPDVGKYTVNSDGTVTFVPCTTVTGVTCAGSYLGGSSIFTGTTSVRYVVADQVGQYGSSTLDVDVLPPPVVKPVNDIGTSPFATSVVFDPLANDSGGTTSGLTGYASTDTATVNVSTLKLCGTGQSAPSCNASSVVTPEGVYTLNAVTNRITFVPATNFVGTPAIPPLYMVCNQLGSGWSPMPSTTCATAKVTPTIQPPVAPSAVDDARTGPYNTPIVIEVLGNDSKDSALTISPSSLKLCAAAQVVPNCTATSVQVANEGTYSLDSTNGQVTFTPLPSFAGTPTVTPTYQFTDSFGATASAVITPTITPPNAPTASPQVKTVLPGASVRFTNVIGASGLAGGTGLKSGTNGGPCLVDPADSVCKTSFTVMGEGDWSIDQDTGIPTFVADASAISGNQTAVSYRVADAVGQSASALLTPVIPPPAALTADTGTGGLDSDQAFDVLSNDTAGTGTTLVATTVKLCDTGQASPNCVATSITVNGEGTYTVDASGVVTFDPDPNFTGQATPITYQVNDSVGRSYTNIITPTVTATPPTAAPDTVLLPLGDTRSFRSIHAVGGLVTRNLGGTALDPASVCIVDPGTSICGASPIVISGEGTYTLDPATGIVTYVADPNATPGPQTPITYKLSDRAGHTVQSTLSPVIVAPPTTASDASSGSRGARQVVSVLGNDVPGANSAPLVPTSVRLCGASDVAPNCSATTITIAGQGTFTVDTTTGDIVFTPVSTFTGDATPVVYSVTDSLGQRRSSSVIISVQPDNSAPQQNGSGGGGSSLPTTGRNTSDHIGLILVIIAIGVILDRVARRRNVIVR